MSAETEVTASQTRFMPAHWFDRWWVRVVAIFVASRVVSTTLLLILANVQGRNPWTGPRPSYFDYASIWDGRWYNIVAVWGYPSQLPIDTAGHIAQNAWAFMPGYPTVVSAVMFMTRMPWAPAAVFVSTAFALGAALMFYKLMRVRFKPSTSRFAVVLFCFAPLSPVMQVAYAESMYIFLLAAALFLLLKRRYWLLAPVVLAMGFTRPSGLAFALAMVFHLIYRWVRRERDPFAIADRLSAGFVAVFAGIVGLAWPAIAAMVTGSLTAYTDTELAWRAGYIGYGHLIPFSSWIEGAHWWFAVWLGLPAWLGYLALALVVVSFSVALFLPSVRKLGIDLRFWCAAYALYLLAVFFPQSSTFRLLMPLFPLLGAMAIPTNKVYRTLIVFACIAGQLGWLLLCWGVDGADWSPP